MVSILDGSEQLKNSDVKRCKASFWPMWLTWRTKEGSWTAFEHENKKPLVALILYDDAFKCFQCIWVLEWAPFITLLWHPFLSGSHFPLCSTSKHLRESGLRTFDSISFCCFFFFTHQKNKKNKNGWGMLEFIRHTELINRWTSIMNQAEREIVLKPANSPSHGPRHQSLLVWSSRTCHSCRSMSARPNVPTISWIHPRWNCSISSSRVFSKDSPTKPTSELFRNSVGAATKLTSRHLLRRQSNLPHNEPLTNVHPEWKYRGTPLLSFLTLDSSLDWWLKS